MRLFGRKKSTQDEPPAISRPRAQGHLPTPPAPAPKPASTRRSLGSTQTTPLYARFARADSFENLSLRARPDSRAPSYAPTQQELEQDAQRLGYDRPWAQELMSALETDPEPSIRVVSNPKPVPDKRMSLDAVAATDPFMASKMQSVMRRAPSNVRTPEPPKRSVTALVAGPAPNPPPPRIPTAPPTRAVSRSAPKPSFDDDESASRPLPSTAKRERGPPPVAGTPSAYAWKSGQSDDGHGGSNFYTGGSQANPFPPPTAPSSFTLPPGAAPPDPYGTSAPGPSVLKKRTPSNPPTNRTPAPHTRRMSVDGGNARPLSGGPGTWGGSAIAVPSTGPGRERERDTTGPNPAGPNSMGINLTGPNLNGPNSYVASPTTTYADLSRAPTVRSVQPGEIFHHPGAPLPLPASQQAPYQAVTPPPPPAKSPVTVGRGAKPVPQRQVTSPQPVSPQPPQPSQAPQLNQAPQTNQLPQAPQANKAAPPPQPTQPPQQRPTPITTTTTSTKKHTLPPGAAPAEPAKHSPGSYSPGYSAYGPTPGSAYGSYGVNGESPVRKVDGESLVRKQDGESSVRRQDGGKASQVASQVSDARATQASDARTLDARTTSQVSASQVSDARTTQVSDARATQVSDTRASQASDFRKSQASDVRTIQAEPRPSVPSQFGEPTRPAPSQFTEPTKSVPNQFTEPTKPVPNQFAQGLKPVPSPVGKSESTWSRSVAAESTRSVESRSVVIESTPGRAIEATRPVAEPTRSAKLEPTRPVAEPARSVAEPTRSTATESTRSATLEPTRPSLEPTGRTSTHGDPRSSTYSRASSVSVVPPSTPIPPSPTKSRSTSSPVRNLPPRPGPSPLPHSPLQSGAVPPSSMHSIPPRAPSSMSVSSYGTALPLESEPGSEPPSKLALGGLAPINTTTRSGSPTPTASSSAMVTARMTPTTSAALSPQHLGVPRSVSPTPTTSTRADDSDTESAVKKRNLLVKTRKMDGASSFRTSEERPMSVAQPQSPGPGLGLSGGEDPFARSPPTIVKSTKRVVEPAPKRAMPLSPPLSSDDHDTQAFPAVDQQDDRSPMTPALTDEADAEPESTTPPGSPPLPKIYPLETHMNMPSLLAALLPHISFRDWNALNALNAGVRRQLEETRALREEVLEYWLRGVGYARWKSHKRELLTLTLRDLNAYMRGVSIAVYRYSAIAESFLAVRAQQEQTKERVPGAASKGNLVRALASSCRAYTKVILRLREQADFMPGEDFRSPLFKSGNAPLLRVFVPSKEGAWLSDTSVLDCEKELKRAGALGVLRVGDVVWDTAVGDEGNAGRMVWDGNYLVDLDYTYSTTGELPKYIHSLAFSPSYWHKIIRTSNSPLCHIDLTPYAAEIAANLHLVQDRVQTETPQGGRHTVVRWVHRSRFQIRTGLPIPGASPPALVDRMWEGYMVVEVEGTNEGLADLQTRVGNAVRLFPTKTAGMELGPPTGKSPFRLLRSASRPGEIWIRAVREKERLI